MSDIKPWLCECIQKYTHKSESEQYLDGVTAVAQGIELRLYRLDKRQHYMQIEQGHCSKADWWSKEDISAKIDLESSDIVRALECVCEELRFPPNKHMLDVTYLRYGLTNRFARCYLTIQGSSVE